MKGLLREKRIHFMKLIRPFRNNKGISQALLIPITLAIFVLLAYVSVDVFGYFSVRNKLNTAVNEQLEIMKVENGYDSASRSQFDTFVTKLGIDPSKVTVRATSKTVQRGDPLSIEAEMDYETIALKPLGQSFSWRIVAKSNGLAHRLIR